jgi:hypothetical protein
MPLHENPGPVTHKEPIPTPNLTNLDTFDTEAGQMPLDKNPGPGTNKESTPPLNLANLDVVDAGAGETPSDKNVGPGTDKEPTPRATTKGADKRAGSPSPLTNDPSTAARTADVPPTHTPPRLSREDSNILSTMTSTPQTLEPPPKAAVHPKPRPAYTTALLERARAEAEAAAKAAELRSAADVEAAKTLASSVEGTITATPPSPRLPSPSPDVCPSEAETSHFLPPEMAPPDDPPNGSRHRRTLTQFGLNHAKQVEERNAKAEKLKSKKAGKGPLNKLAGVSKANGKGKKRSK